MSSISVSEPGLKKRVLAEIGSSGDEPIDLRLSSPLKDILETTVADFRRIYLSVVTEDRFRAKLEKAAKGVSCETWTTCHDYKSDLCRRLGDTANDTFKRSTRIRDAITQSVKNVLFESSGLAMHGADKDTVRAALLHTGASIDVALCSLHYELAVRKRMDQQVQALDINTLVADAAAHSRERASAPTKATSIFSAAFSFFALGGVALAGSRCRGG